jgi:hypothetical protein
MLDTPVEWVAAARCLVPHVRFVLDDLRALSAEGNAARSTAPLPGLALLARWALRTWGRLLDASEPQRAEEGRKAWEGLMGTCEGDVFGKGA